MTRTAAPSRAPSSTGSRLVAWLRLLRLPNLLTVPGDPVAGYLLAAGPAASLGRPLALAALMALLLYAAGLIMNDVLDQATDRSERPHRPLPAGLVDEATARLVMVTLLALALLLGRYLGWRPAAMALGLVAGVAAYNGGFKRTAAGPLVMGACRGLSLLLGASLAGWGTPLVWCAAAAMAGYVAAVTAVARHEMSGAAPTWWSALPPLAVLGVVAALLALTPLAPEEQGRLGGVLFLAFSLAGLGAWRVHAGGRRRIPEAIGLWLSTLLVLQAACCIASNAGTRALPLALGLLLLWPAHRFLAIRFPAS